jgi:hypothetical protein
MSKPLPHLNPLVLVKINQNCLVDIMSDDLVLNGFQMELLDCELQHNDLFVIH